MSKITRVKWIDGVAQVEALSSNPSPTKKKEKEKKERENKLAGVVHAYNSSSSEAETGS
jgi:hypothetical protein